MLCVMVKLLHYNMCSMDIVDVRTVNYSLNNLRVGSKELEEKKLEKIDTTAEVVAELIDNLSEGWNTLGLSGREAEVAAYRQLGFTNKAIAYMLDLSPNTVNEYTRRVNEKIETAKQLVNHAQRTEAFEKDWNCPNCRGGIRRSHGDTEVSLDDETISYRCRSCFEEFTRPIYSAPQQG